MIAMRRLLLALALAPWFAPAQDLKEFEKKVTEFTLGNGLHFTLVERHDAPVVSFHTYVGAGAAGDPSGTTGIAHMFEHMAFKGTETIGSRNWPEEKKAMEAVEEVYDKLEAERARGPKADEKRIQGFEYQLKLAIGKAGMYVEPNLYPSIIERNGGVGVNAATAMDSTEYHYSLPSNRIELWFLLESQRFLKPVFREFYKERDVVMEEYRQRVESSPQGKLLQAFVATAFAAHPYRNPGAGWPSDIQNLRRADALEFYRRYYAPANINMAICGDVDKVEARRLAEKYFGPLPARPLPPLLHTVEPPQAGPKQVAVESPSQPLLLVGYKRPDVYDKDDPVLEVMAGVLSSGRTGWLYTDLVRDRKVALLAQAQDSFPGTRYPNMFIFFLVPNAGRSVEEAQKALEEVLARFRSQRVDEVTLRRVKNKTRATLLRHLDSNAGLAALLTTYYGVYGDWRKLFTALDDAGKVTAADIERAAAQYFVPQGRTVAYTMAPVRAAGGVR
jgi:predicted Zn-dependent peptidase